LRTPTDGRGNEAGHQAAGSHPGGTLRYFSLGEADLARIHAPGKWSVRYILHHLTDSETVFFERIRRVLSEPRQVVWFYDQDAWAKALDYASSTFTAGMGSGA
jgi:DinB superfamily